MKQLHPRAIWLMFFSSFITWIIIFVVIGLTLAEIQIAFNSAIIKSFIQKLNSVLLLIGVLILISNYVWARLAFRFYRYELTHDGFRQESGVIWKHYVFVPYERIQNVDIYRGIWARILGISEMQIHTAGTQGALPEGRLPGLSIKEAELIKEELIKCIRQSKNQEL